MSGLAGTSNYGPLYIASLKATTKASPIGADKILLLDSENSDDLVSSAISDLPGGTTVGWSGSVTDNPHSVTKSDVALKTGGISNLDAITLILQSVEPIKEMVKKDIKKQ